MDKETINETNQIIVALIMATAGIIAAAIPLLPLPFVIVILFIVPVFDYFIFKKLTKQLKTLPPTDKAKNYIGGLTIISVLIFIVGIFYLVWFYWIDEHIEITYPHNGDQVGLYETIIGKAQNISDQYSVWIIIYSHPDKRYYPNNQKAAVISKSKSFTSTDTLIGARQDIGEKFDVIALLVNAQNQQILQNHLDNPNSAGLPSMPPGKVYDLITVTRK